MLATSITVPLAPSFKMLSVLLDKSLEELLGYS